MKRPLVIGCLLLLGLTACEHLPSDQALVRRLEGRQAGFDRLAALAEGDKTLYRLTRDRVELLTESSQSPFRPPTERELPAQRLNDYRALLKELKLQSIEWNRRDAPGIFLTAACVGMLHGRCKGFAFLERAPGETAASLDEENARFRGAVRPPRLIFKPLQGRWYLFWEAD